MFKGRYKSETRALIYSTFTGILMAFTIDPFFLSPFSILILLKTALTNILLSFIASLIFPSTKYGELLAGKLKLKTGGFGFVLVSTSVTTIYLTFVKTIYCTIVKSGFMNAHQSNFLINLFIALTLDFIYRASLYLPVTKLLELIYPNND